MITSGKKCYVICDCRIHLEYLTNFRIFNSFQYIIHSVDFPSPHVESLIKIVIQEPPKEILNLE